MTYEPRMGLYEKGCWIIGVVTFFACWIYAVASWGFLLGFGLGWIPSFFIACIAGLLWPLLAAGLAICACIGIYLSFSQSTGNTKYRVGKFIVEEIQPDDPLRWRAIGRSHNQGMNIAEFRETYPQYNDMSDQKLAHSLYAKFYSDMDQGEFLSKFMGKVSDRANQTQ